MNGLVDHQGLQQEERGRVVTRVWRSTPDMSGGEMDDGGEMMEQDGRWGEMMEQDGRW